MEDMETQNEKFNVGDRVHYDDGHGKVENGIVKSLHHSRNDAVFVVYHCAGEWDRYFDYTAALTDFRNLYHGWDHAG